MRESDGVGVNTSVQRYKGEVQMPVRCSDALHTSFDRFLGAVLPSRHLCCFKHHARKMHCCLLHLDTHRYQPALITLQTGTVLPTVVHLGRQLQFCLVHSVRGRLTSAQYPWQTAQFCLANHGTQVQVCLIHYGRQVQVCLVYYGRKLQVCLVQYTMVDRRKYAFYTRVVKFMSALYTMVEKCRSPPCTPWQTSAVLPCTPLQTGTVSPCISRQVEFCAVLHGRRCSFALYSMVDRCSSALYFVVDQYSLPCSLWQTSKVYICSFVLFSMVILPRTSWQPGVATLYTMVYR